MLTLELFSRIVHMSTTNMHTHMHTQKFNLEEYRPRLLHGMVQVSAQVSLFLKMEMMTETLHSSVTTPVLNT